MKGAIEEANRLVNQNKNYFLPQQFNNPTNPQKHYKTTAEEILQDFSSLKVEANSVVLTDVSDYAIAVGIPAKIIKKSI